MKYRVFVLAAISVLLGAAGATHVVRVNEAAKSPAVICGIHTRINLKTLAALRASKFVCASIARGKAKPLRPHRTKVAIHALAPSVIVTRLHLVPRSAIHISKTPLVPVVTSVNTAGWNALGTWINDTGPKPVVMPGLSIVIQGHDFIGPPNALSNGGPVANITFAGCPGANGTFVHITSYDSTRIVGTVGFPRNDGEVPNQSIPASLTIQTTAGTSQSYALTWAPILEQDQVQMSVLFIPYVSHLTQYAGEAWLSAANAQLANSGSRTSAFPAYIGGMGGKGDDLVGTNVRLLNGWRLVNTQIISVMDGDGNPSTDTGESARGARIERTGPAGGLTTDVHWWYDADHTISYNVLWTLEGPMGYRAMSQEPMQGGICEE